MKDLDSYKHLYEAIKKGEPFDESWDSYDKAIAAIQAYIALNYIPKQELSRLLEEMVDKRPFPGMGGAAPHSEIRETCYKQGRNECLAELKKELGL